MRGSIRLTKLCMVLLLVGFSGTSYAALCSASAAHILSVHRWTDSVVYLNIDKNNNCGCAIPNRFGYWDTAVDVELKKMWLSMAMAAVVSKQAVTIYGDDTQCALIGNTASVTSLKFGQ